MPANGNEIDTDDELEAARRVKYYLLNHILQTCFLIKATLAISKIFEVNTRNQSVTTLKNMQILWFHSEN